MCKINTTEQSGKGGFQFSVTFFQILQGSEIYYFKLLEMPWLREQNPRYLILHKTDCNTHMPPAAKD